MENPGRTVSEREVEIILPPPTPLNPIPALTVALRVDNNEQLLSLLQTDPQGVGSFSQLLVFGTVSLRTLLMRQVLSDPHTQTFKGKKKNWDSYLDFSIPRGLNIVGTRLVSPSSADALEDSKYGQVDESDKEPWDDEADNKIDVIT